MFKKILLVAVLCWLQTAVSYAKFEVSDEDFRGSYEVKHIEETPAPVPGKADSDRGFIAFMRYPEAMVFSNTNPKKDEITDVFKLVSAKGQPEIVTLGIWPMKDMTGTKVLPSDLVSAGGKISKSNIDVRVVRYMSQTVGLPYMKNYLVMPKLLEKVEAFNIKSGVTRQFWLTIKIPEDAKEGKYTGEVAITYEGGKGVVKLEVEVLPFSVADNPKLTYAMCGEEIDERCFIDQKEHLMNTIFPNGFSNKEVEKALELYKKTGFKHFIIPFYMDMPTASKGGFKNYKSSKEIPRAKEIAEYFVGKCKKEGLPPIAWVPVDEPGIGEMIDGVSIGTKRNDIARELLTAIRTVPGAMTAETVSVGSVEPLFELLDVIVWGNFTEEAVVKAQKAKKLCWYYPNGAVSPMGESNTGYIYSRYSHSYFPWMYNLDGVTAWTYPMGPSWKPTDYMGKGEKGIKREKGWIGVDGKPIPSIQWELCRQGIVDARYIYKLETLVKEGSKSSKAGAKSAAKEGEQLLVALKLMAEKHKKAYKTHFASGEELVTPEVIDGKKFVEMRQQLVNAIQNIMKNL